MPHLFGLCTLPVLVLLLSAIATYLLLWVLIPWLRVRMLDSPNARSSHHCPTPRGGGLAFVLVASLSSCFLFFASVPANFSTSCLPLLALPLAIVGLFDDTHNLTAGFRFVVQLFTVSILLLFSNLTLPWFLIPLLLIIGTSAINFTNFMDGLDGLVSGCMAIAISALAFVQPVSPAIWALVGSLIGFLVWNWEAAKVFMGDVGSTFLGAVFFGLVLQAHSWSEALGSLFIVTPLFGDACFCVIRRLFAGQPVFQAHRLHLFQRLHQAGWPHHRVSSFYILATVLLAVVFLACSLFWVIAVAIAELCILFVLDHFVAVPFSLSLKS